jgi:hypothetical protein
MVEQRVNRQELQVVLSRAGVHPGLYSLDVPAPQSESYSLVQDGEAWKVLYKERGEFQQVQAGLSESAACQLIYKLLDSAVGLSRRQHEALTTRPSGAVPAPLNSSVTHSV